MEGGGSHRFFSELVCQGRKATGLSLGEKEQILFQHVIIEHKIVAMNLGAYEYGWR